MEVYRIKDWDKHFENHQSRKLENLNWVPFPNKHDGDGYIELTQEHHNGCAHYGAWCVLAQVASKCEPRGTLIRDGGRPHTPETLSRKTGFPKELLQEALERLCGSVNWMEVVEIEGVTKSADRAADEARSKRGQSADEARSNRAEGNGTELNRTERTERTEPNRTENAVGRSVDFSVGEDRRVEIKREWDRIREVVPIKDGKYNLDDRQELFKIATMRVLGFVSEDAIEDSLDAVRRKNPNPAWKFFRKGVIARSQGFDVEELLGRMSVPDWAIPLVNNQARTVKA